MTELQRQRLEDVAFDARVLLPVLHRMTQAAEDADRPTIKIPTGHGWTILSVLQFVEALHHAENTQVSGGTPSAGALGSEGGRR